MESLYATGAISKNLQKSRVLSRHLRMQIKSSLKMAVDYSSSRVMKNWPRPHPSRKPNIISRTRTCEEALVFWPWATNASSTRLPKSNCSRGHLTAQIPHVANSKPLQNRCNNSIKCRAKCCLTPTSRVKSRRLCVGTCQMTELHL